MDGLLAEDPKLEAQTPALRVVYLQLRVLAREEMLARIAPGLRVPGEEGEGSDGDVDRPPGLLQSAGTLVHARCAP